MGKQLGFYIDQSSCSGCKACQTACKDKNDLEYGQLFRQVTETCGGTFTPKGSAYTQDVFAYYTSISCNHCDNPLCVKNCPKGAMHKRPEDGVVVVDQEKCTGCRICVKVCPYGAPQYSTVKQKVTKCDFCLDMLAKGEEPACVAACPLHAIKFGEIQELRKEFGELACTRDMASSSVTGPNLVIKPHRGALEQE